MKDERFVIEHTQVLEHHLHDEVNTKVRLELAFLHCLSSLSSDLSELCKSFGIAESPYVKIVVAFFEIDNWGRNGHKYATLS